MKEKYVIFNPEGGLGKIIASTAVIRAIKLKYEGYKIIVITPWPEVYLNNPNVYRVYRSGNTPYFYKDYIKNNECVVFKGEPYFNTGHLYKRQHLIKSWCETHNLDYDGNNKPELYFTVAEKEKIARDNQEQKPILIMQTNGGMYTNEKSYCWTRDMPFNQSRILANRLSQDYVIYHITRPKCPKLPNVKIVNDVDKRTLMLLLLISSKRLLIDSCLQHAAAALNLPSTVLWIGTHPTVFGYDLHTNILPAVSMEETNSTYIDSLFFNHDFNGPEYDYPFEGTDLFNLQEVYDSITK